MKYIEKKIEWFRLTLEQADMFSLHRWGYFFAAAIFGVTAGILSYEYLDLPQSYPDLIVGSIAWEYGSKFRDYITPFNIIIGFLLSFFGLAILAGRVAVRYGAVAQARFHDLVVMLCLPAVMGSATMLISRVSPLTYFCISAFLLSLCFLLASVMLKTGKYDVKQGAGEPYVDVLRNLLLLILCSLAAGAAAGVALSRAGVFFPTDQLHGFSAFKKLSLVGLITGIVLAFAILLYPGDPRTKTNRIWKGILVTQLFFPGFFLLLIGKVFFNDDGRMHAAAPLSFWGYAVIIACMVALYISLYRNHRRRMQTEAPDLFNFIPTMSMLGVLLLLRALPVSVFETMMDDYHFGEFAIPWLTWVEKGMIPFWDYAPARGGFNYYQGAFAVFFFDGQTTSFGSTVTFLMLFMFLPALFLLKRVIGYGPAIIAILLSGRFNGISEIDMFVTIYMGSLMYGFLHWFRHTWLAAYVCLSAGILLMAPGQGALAIASLSPLFLYQAFKAWQAKERKTYIVFGITCVVMLAICLITPLGKMLLGAFRYGLEQSALNSVANGIEWKWTFSLAPINPWLYEAIRCLWISLAIIAGLNIMKAMTTAGKPDRRKILAFNIPIFIVLVLFIVRAAGRIDTVWLTRLGIASIWATSMLLPMMIVQHTKGKMSMAVICLWVFAGGSLAAGYPELLADGMFKRWQSVMKPVHAPAPYDGKSIATDKHLPRIVRNRQDTAQLARLQSLNRLLSHVLKPGETYLDMTSRHVQYYYLNMRPPVESGSVYNLVTEKQQLRGIRSVKQLQVPAVLLSADNLNWDGGGPALRSYHLYRHILLEPDFSIVALHDSIVWLIRNDRIPHIPPSLIAKVYHVDASPDNPLDLIFSPMDISLNGNRISFTTPSSGQYLKQLPASWGRSAESLRSKMRELWRLGPAEWYPTPSVAPDGKGGYLMKDERSDLVFAIHAKNLKGKDAGLLSFEVQCTPADRKPELAIYWSGKGVPPNDERTKVRFKARNGRMIVPMDAVPSWLLSPALETLMIVTTSRDSASVIRISDIRLMQRK